MILIQIFICIQITSIYKIQIMHFDITHVCASLGIIKSNKKMFDLL